MEHRIYQDSETSLYDTVMAGTGLDAFVKTHREPHANYRPVNTLYQHWLLDCNTRTTHTKAGRHPQGKGGRQPVTTCCYPVCLTQSMKD